MNYSLEQEILAVQSYEAFASILNGYHLEDFQTADLLKALYHKRYILAYDTGLGKTLLASAFMKLLRNENPNRKFIMIVLKSQLAQTPKKIRDATGFRITCITAEDSVIDSQLLNKDITSSDIIIMTHDCLNNIKVRVALFNNKDLFSGLIIDEAHELSNIQGASSAFSLFTMCKQFEFVLALTATPITTKITQLANLMYIVNRHAIPDLKTAEEILDRDGVNAFRDVVVTRTRKDLGIFSNYVPHVHMVKALPEQSGACGVNMFEITKGRGAYPQVNKLIDIIQNAKPDKGLVYINRHATREFVVEELNKTDIRFDCINGKTSLLERKRIAEAFNNNQLDIIITSVTSALDLDCEYIIFYEFTVNVKQMLGRGERGLNPKTLDIHYIFTTHTEEPAYFIRNIYERSLLVKRVMGQDVNHVIKAVQQMKAF